MVGARASRPLGASSAVGVAVVLPPPCGESQGRQYNCRPNGSPDGGAPSIAARYRPDGAFDPGGVLQAAFDLDGRDAGAAQRVEAADGGQVAHGERRAGGPAFNGPRHAAGAGACAAVAAVPADPTR